jgi:tetratricopeptide repeat protein 8
MGTASGVSRPMTTLGRLIRLGTASMLSTPDGPFVNVARLDLRKYAARPAIARALFDYIWYVDHDHRKALELAAAATVDAKYSDWMWKVCLGKSYCSLGLYREAEAQLRSATKTSPFCGVAAYLELAKVHVRLDQPLLALGKSEE